ncbi:hypothetical protein [Pseudonocardia hydrocarbonoxydans]|uniref:hypothetical protein n=1 Tax=Pseudonocardia hydrocarbonoxydans TaxID=76726 RepID=UPI0031D2E424
MMAEVGTTRRRTMLLVALTGLLAIGLIGWWTLPSRANTAAPPGMEAQTVQAGAVEVRMTPLTVDRSGAEFGLVLDTHTVPLDLDLPGAAQLRVNGDLAGAPAWDGPGPGGHHREGTLRFTTPIPPGATVELRITGLPQDAAATWTAL